MVNSYFSGKVSQLTLNFLNVLATKRREGFVAQIYE
ncbi:MAG: F0F1 ATP synthase subunit delta, partial [Firmicutes bacterium]|nr:F0F1 ATP synthase subunit delta [Bacillota bacterium]